MQRVTEWRPDGGRNFVRLDDEVKVLPSRPKKRDGFMARVKEIKADDEGTVIEVTVVGGCGFKTVRPDRIQRVAQTKGGAAKERVR